MVGVHTLQSKAVFLTLMVSLLMCNTASWAANVEVPRLTLANMEETYSLAGLWQFQPGDDFQWALPEFDDSSWSSRRVPKRWSQVGFPEHGQLAWYRLTLNLDSEQRDVLTRVGVQMGKVLNAYELFAGGQLIGGVGKLPPLSKVNYDRTRVYRIPPSAIDIDGSLVLALRVWGGSELAVSNWGGGPHEGEFRIGDYDSLLQSSIFDEIPGLMVSVLFFGFGCYHIYLYRRNRQLMTYLWYGLTALDIGIYSLMSNQWRYRLDWSFVAFEKMEYGAIYLFPALVIQMIWSLLDLPIGRLLRVYQCCFIAFAFVVVLVPSIDIHYITLRPWQMWSIPLLGLIPWVIVRETRKGNPEARTALLGVLVFFAACTNDLMIDLAGWHAVRLVPLGFVAIMLSMAISLANRFTTVLNDLEGQVAERTTDLITANEKLAEAARRDPLTGLLNRRGFIDEAKSEIRRFMRTAKEPSFILADLDNFKDFNDHYGHACGDHVLRQVAQVLTERVRNMDEIARWGGEEFIFMLPESSSTSASQVAEKLRAFLENEQFEFEGQHLGVTMTFGIATFHKDETLDQCIARADAAMYEGKERGRNRVSVDGPPELSLIS